MAVKKTESSLYLNTFSFFLRLGLSLLLFFALFPQFFSFLFLFSSSSHLWLSVCRVDFSFFLPCPSEGKEKVIYWSAYSISTSVYQSVSQSMCVQGSLTLPISGLIPELYIHELSQANWWTAETKKKGKAIENREFFYSSSIITKYIIFGTYIGRWTFFSPVPCLREVSLA